VPREPTLFFPTSKEISLNKLIAALIAAAFSFGAFAQTTAPAGEASTSASAPAKKAKVAKKHTVKKAKKAASAPAA